MPSIAVSNITPQMIADALELSLNDAWRFARSTTRQYHPPRKKITRGKEREFDIPKHHFQHILKRLHRLLVELKLFHKSAFGGIKKRSPQKSARRHCGKRFQFTRDIKNCFPSISPQMLERELHATGFRSDTSEFLSLLLTVRGRVPQGATTSMDAINLFFRRIDEEIFLLCQHSGFTYTRYVDDCVISGTDENMGKYLIGRIEKILEDSGLTINRTKSKNTFTNSRRQTVQGFLVHRPSGTSINPEKTKIALEIARNYILQCKSVTLSTVEETAKLRAKLLGYWATFRSADFSIAKHLKTQMNIGDRLALHALKRLGIQLKTEKWWTRSAIKS